MYVCVLVYLLLVLFTYTYVLGHAQCLPLGYCCRCFISSLTSQPFPFPLHPSLCSSSCGHMCGRELHISIPPSSPPTSSLSTTICHVLTTFMYTGVHHMYFHFYCVSLPSFPSPLPFLSPPPSSSCPPFFSFSSSFLSPSLSQGQLSLQFQGSSNGLYCVVCSSLAFRSKNFLGCFGR